MSTAICRDGQSTTTARIPFANGISADSITEVTATNGVTIGKVNAALGADIASATGAGTLNLTTATGQIVDVTGTTTITAITLAQGSYRWVRFTGALLLTNGASLVIPGGANYTTAAGDYFLFVGYAAGVVRVAAYALASGSSLATSSTAVTAASTFGTDNSILRADGTSRGAQSTTTVGTMDDAGSPSFGPALTSTSTDAGATAGPIHTLDRNSASPAAADVIGTWAATGRDSGGGTDTYAQVQCEIVDATAGTEDGLWNWLTKIAGTLATRMKLGAGLYMDGATGGDKGAGTVNATAYYINGAALQSGLVVIQTNNPSAVANSDFTTGIDSTYDTYEFELINVIPASNATFLMQVSLSGAPSTFITANYQYAGNSIQVDATDAPAGSSSTSAIDLTLGSQQLSTASIGGWSGKVTLRNPSSSTVNKAFRFDGWMSNTTRYQTVQGGGTYSGAQTAIVGVRFMFNAVNIASGKIVLRGLSKT